MTQTPFPKSFPSQADPRAIVTGPHVRFTVLTSRMIRMEYSRTDVFEDRASQAFWYRRQPVPVFQVTQTPEQIEITTDHLRLCYQVTEQGFVRKTLTIQLLASGVTWHSGDRDRKNLRGTARTLDGADGAIELEPGLLSRAGWSVVDDSSSLIFQDGWLDVRPAAKADEYRDVTFLGYGHDYVGCLQDYCRVSGRVPLVPRFALGNWWSRYWAYSQSDLRDLMVEFKQRQAPLSVCIIDMDWHITETGNASSGWTGYTWNRDLWPDPNGFIAWLHEQGLKTAMNLHPAEGIWPHEEQYEAMARHMGLDPASQEPVNFDLADPQFAEGYFDILHHPFEDKGVDFWWLDWQQGARIQHSRQPVAEQMDPLWWLNHLHFYDSGRDGHKRPFIFSRWGGLGNQRYPIGFSGDSHVTWDTLKFQPYFTANASNVAFGWWSHDIGGHCAGMEEPELYARWVQLGVFSPILRLHSTNNPFHDRRPWGNGDEAFRVTRDAMQLRHALIPYIYSMAWRMTQASIPLVTPLYYWHPEAEEAYHCHTQFWFGSELMIAPFVTPRNPDTNLSRHTVWLPEGDWFNLFTGEHFAGGCSITLYGTLDEIPVLAKAGGIVPLGPRVGWGGVDNPDEMTVFIFPGADGAFTLYEDDGNSTAYLKGDYALTEFSQSWHGDHLRFQVAKVEGEARHVPAQRRYQLVVRGVRKPDEVQLEVNGVVLNGVVPNGVGRGANGAAQSAAWQYDAATESLTLPAVHVGPSDELSLTVGVASGMLYPTPLLSKRDRRLETCRAMLRSFRLESEVKRELDKALPGLVQDPKLLQRFGGEVDEVREAQWTALKDVLSRGV